MERRKLKVVGQASKKVSPDMAKVYLNLVAEAQTAELSNSIFNNKAKLLSNVFKQLKLNEDELKTEHFYTDKNYVYENNTRVDKGYKTVCTYSYIMKLDYAKLQKLIENASVALEMRITYDAYLKDDEKVEKEVIAEAFKDAKQKAELLAKTCSVKLGDIAEIYYGDSPSFIGLRAARECSLAPSEVEVSRTVEVSWEIL